MKILVTVIFTTMLTGCATVERWIPSFWDDNQSARITDLRISIDRVDCAQPQLAQAQRVAEDLRWFEFYSQSKGRLQKDVLRLIEPIQATANEWRDRAQKSEPSKGYCEIKKKILQQQSERAAAGVLGRW